MRLIYQNAQTVIIWLGPSNGQIDCLFDSMAALDQQALTIPRPQTIRTWEYQWFWVILHLHGKPPPDKIRTALIELLRHKWFSRVWVLQEAALAKSAMITCGRNEVNSRAFVVMPSLLSVKCSAVQQSRLDILPGLLRAKSWWGESSDKNLITLIQKFGKSEASDPRDIIYALLGLSGDTHSSDFLRPDYQISLDEAIQRSVTYFMIQTHDLPRHTPVHALPKWNMDTFLNSLKDLSFRVFQWATDNAQDLLLYYLLISQRDKQDTELVKRYMNYSGNYGPLITIALRKENMPLIELLMEFPDTEVEERDSHGDCPLSIAAGQGNTAVMDWISARSQFDAHRGDTHHKTPTWIAANQHFLGPMQNTFYRVEFDTPLLTAVKQKHPAVVQSILKHGEESTYLVDWNGDGLLNIAVRRGDENIVDIILQKSNLDHHLRFRGSNGLTPLESALVAGSPAIITRFLVHHGQHAVHSAVRVNGFEFLRKILDVKLHFPEEFHLGFRTALAFAAWAGYTKIASLLLDNGTDINLRDGAGRTAAPLWIAAACGNLKMVKFFVERGADTELTAQEFPTMGPFNLEMWPPSKPREYSRVVNGQTRAKPIWVAASLGHTNVVRFLIHHGADIDSRDSYYGLSPFWRAAQQDHPEVMRVLIEGGADVRPNRLVGWGDWQNEVHRRHRALMALQDYVWFPRTAAE